MTTTPLQNSHFLFDGALLHGTDELAWIQTQAGGVYLYDDLGEAAAQVGPILLPPTEAVNTFAQSLATSDSPLQFACARLICSRGARTLAQHLRQSRYLLAGEGQQYYFRYADSRALAAVWSVLTPPQQVALLGPMTSWECINRNGQLVQRTLSARVARQPTASLPLALQPSQWHGVLEAGRIGELFNDTEAMAPSTAFVHRANQRFTWTRQTYDWMRSLGISDPLLRREANLAVWRTGGCLLHETLFKIALLDARQTGNPAPIRRFGELD